MSITPETIVKRNKKVCRTCKACEAACPTGAMSLNSQSNYLWTECSRCGACIDACPVRALSWENIPAAQWDDRAIRYFAQPGPQNTLGVVQAVKERLELGDVTTVVCGSISGASATLLADAGPPEGTRLINVSAPADAFERYGYGFTPITEKGKTELTKRGITILELKTNWAPLSPMTCYSSNIPQTFELSDAGLALYEGLINVGGMGLKVAVLSVLDACLQGAIPIGERVVGVGRTWFGFDTAALIHATTPDSVFGPDPARRLTVEEIIATA